MNKIDFNTYKDQDRRRIESDKNIAIKIVAKLEGDLKQIDEYLAGDLRVVKQVNSAGQKMEETIQVCKI